MSFPFPWHSDPLCSQKVPWLEQALQHLFLTPTLDGDVLWGKMVPGGGLDMDKVIPLSQQVISSISVLQAVWNWEGLICKPKNPAAFRNQKVIAFNLHSLEQVKEFQQFWFLQNIWSDTCINLALTQFQIPAERESLKIWPDLLCSLNSCSPTAALQIQSEVEPDSSKPPVLPLSQRAPGIWVAHPETLSLCCLFSLAASY